MQQLKSGSFLQEGKYKIEKVLGQGGFGITYLATQELLDRKVCIKEFFFKEYCERDEATSHVSLGTQSNHEIVERFMTKFLKEARTISQLDHRNIIKIHDIFKENNTAYYVMEFIEGESLADKVNRNGALPETEAVEYIKQVASALDFIHRQSINHLDVKPANIMIRRSDNKAVLIDFGLSKQYDEQGGQTSTTPVGISHGYAPMEQYKQGGVSTFSPQTDIYALGATLYKLVTGNTPPQASDVLNDGLPQLPTSVSASVVNVVENTMLPRKVDRPKNVTDFLLLFNKESRVKESVLDDETTKFIQEEKQKQQEQTSTNVNNRQKSSKKNWIIPCLIVSIVTLAIFFWIKNNREEVGTPIVDTQINKPIVNADSVGLNDIENHVPKMVPLYITTSPTGASVSVDGKLIGKTPIENKEFEVGKHTIEIIMDGYEKISERVIFEDKPVVLNKTLQSDKKQVDVLSNKQSYLINGVTFNMVHVDGGTFQMGSNASEMFNSKDFDDEKPIHTVTLSNYWIGETEVTQALWVAVMGSNPSEFKGDNLPVQCVNWNDCMEFIRTLNNLTGKKFRMPTEAEWEFAARGGIKSHGYLYSGSNNIDEVGWYGGNSGAKPHEVGSLSPNELGIYDMSGNVYEWCNDWYGEYPSSNVANPQGPTIGNERVIRGGGFGGNAVYNHRLSLRNKSLLHYRPTSRGLRLAL